MKTKIEFSFLFREPTPSELEMDKRNDSPTLPRFALEEDFHFLLWQDGDLVYWLRELAARLPNDTPFYGPYLIEASATQAGGNHDPDFIRRLIASRLKKLFFGESPVPRFQLKRVTVTKVNNSLVFGYES